MSARWFVDLYVLFFIHVRSRRVFVAECQPAHKWVTQQARNASKKMAEWGLSVS